MHYGEFQALCGVKRHPNTHLHAGKHRGTRGAASQSFFFFLFFFLVFWQDNFLSQKQAFPPLVLRRVGSSGECNDNTHPPFTQVEASRYNGDVTPKEA